MREFYFFDNDLLTEVHRIGGKHFAVIKQIPSGKVITQRITAKKAHALARMRRVL